MPDDVNTPIDIIHTATINIIRAATVIPMWILAINTHLDKVDASLGSLHLPDGHPDYFDWWAGLPRDQLGDALHACGNAHMLLAEAASSFEEHAPSIRALNAVNVSHLLAAQQRYDRLNKLAKTLFDGFKRLRRPLGGTSGTAPLVFDVKK